MDIGAAIYTAVQMGLLAGCFALTCGSIARQCGARAAKRSAVFFALYPLHMVMAVNATKDVLFGGFFALTLAFLNEMNAKPARSLYAKIAACGALAVMLRNNMAYAALAWLALWSDRFRRKGEMRRWPCCWRWRWALAEMRRSKRDACGGRRHERNALWPIQQLARAARMATSSATRKRRPSTS
ncbi:MAG: hypothetical protein ACLS7Z_08630 [Christensenellales bacterium]